MPLRAYLALLLWIGFWVWGLSAEPTLVVGRDYNWQPTLTTVSLLVPQFLLGLITGRWWVIVLPSALAVVGSTVVAFTDSPTQALEVFGLPIVGSFAVAMGVLVDRFIVGPLELRLRQSRGRGSSASDRGR